MANANAQTHDIDLASPNLNLDKYQLGVSQFDGFNYRNSPFISHEIKNLYTKQTTLTATDAFCIDGDIISLRGRSIYRNDTLIHSFASAVNYYNLNDIKKYYYDNYNQIFAAPKYIDGYLYYLTYNNTDCYLRRITLQNLKSKIYPINNVTTFQLYTNILKIIDIDWIVPQPFTSPRNRYVLTYFYIDTATFYYFVAHPNWRQPIRGEFNDTRDYKIVVQENDYNIFLLSEESNGIPIVRGGYRLSNDSVVTYFSEADYNSAKLQMSNISGVTDGYYTCLKNFIPYKYGFVLSPLGLSTEVFNNIPNINTSKIVAFSGKMISEPLQGLCCRVDHILSDYQQLNTWFFLSEHPAVFNKTHFVFDYYCPCIPFGFFNGYNVYDDEHDKYALIYAVGNTNRIFIKSTIIQYVVGRDTGMDGYCEEFVNDNQFIRLLYNNCVLTGVSALYNNEAYLGATLDEIGASYLFEDNIISNVYDVKHNSIIFDTNKNLWFITVNTNNNIEKLQIFQKRYVIGQTADYLNCYDLKENKLTHIADDWNNRFVYINEGGTLRTDAFAASIGAFFQTDYEQYSIKHTFPGRQANAVFIRRIATTATPQLHNCYISEIFNKSNVYLYGIDVFVSEGEESLTPKYVFTYPYFGILYETNLAYTNLDGNLQEPIPIIADYDNSNIIPIVNMLETTTLLFPIGTTYFALYYLLMVQENTDSIFTIQSNIYGVNDGVIYSLNYKDGIISVNKQIAKCNNLRFLCSTPISAFFWSYFNNTIYQFQGDCLLHRGQVIDEINDILYIDYIEATNDIIMCCDTYTIVLSEQYAYKIDGQYSFCDIDNEYYYLKKFTNTGVTILQIAYKPYLDFTKQNIIVRTQLYGLADNQLSETDCVYVRVFNAEHETRPQTVTIGGFALTDKKTNFTAQTYTITTNGDLKWGEDWTCYLRYQPTFQKALGIQIEIESTVPITYIGVSNIPDTKMITKL